MKKVVMILISIMLIGSLSACSSDKTEPTNIIDTANISNTPTVTNTPTESITEIVTPTVTEVPTKEPVDVTPTEGQTTDIPKNLYELTSSEEILELTKDVVIDENFNPEEYDLSSLMEKNAKGELSDEEKDWLNTYTVWQIRKLEAYQADYLDEINWMAETEPQRKKLEDLFSTQFMFHNRYNDNGFLMSAQTLDEAIEYYTTIEGFDKDIVVEVATEYALSPEEECKELVNYLISIGITKDKMVNALKGRKVRDTSYFNPDDYDWSDCAYNLIKAYQHDRHNSLTDKELKKILKDEGFGKDEIKSAMNKYKEEKGTE